MKLSIIIPYYNRQEQINKLMQRLLPQINESVEVIVVDDHSPEPLIINDERVKIIRLEENSGGASVPRNVGLDNATGEYITFIDSDDLVKPNYVQVILNKINLTRFDYCFFSWESKANQIIIRDNPPSWNCCVWNCIYRRETIGNERFDPKLKIAEDYDFNKRVRRGKKQNILDVLYYYEIDTPNSLIKQGETYNKKYEVQE